VQCTVWLFFCSSLISCFPGTLFRYRLSYFELVRVSAFITGITFWFHIPHALNFYYKMSLYFRIFSVSFKSHLWLIIIIIIIVIISSQNSTGLILQTLLSHSSAINSLIIRHALSCTAFCIRIYRTGRRVSSFNLSCSLFRIIPSVDSTIGITQAACSCHIVISSAFKSAYFWNFSVMAL